MKNSRKEKDKGKGPRVLANTVKKTEKKGLNLSGNRSFLNKSSTNRYISDLRNNNARLAHSLASQKNQTAELFRRYTEAQAVVMGQKAFLRNISHSIKSAVTKFNSAVDLMIDASATCISIKDKIMRYCPELDERNSAQMRNQMDGLGQSSCQPEPSATVLSNASNTNVSYNTTGEDSLASSVPQIRQGTARPMVQGQVISHPTISLQRVVVPTRNLGRAIVKPDRAVQWLSVNSEEESRLSVVPEELNASNRSEADSQTNVSTPQRQSLATSDNSSRLSMPASHVVLERLSPNVHFDRVLSPQIVDADDTQQFTAVNFGSFNFSVSHERECNFTCSPRVNENSKSSPATSKTALESPTSKAALNTSNSDDYLTESSSDDEELALQLVESKKYYLERSRQVDSKEGTSWNYDEAGKFRGKPPKRKRSKKDPDLSKEKKYPETMSSSKTEISGMKSKSTNHSKVFRSPEMKKGHTSKSKEQTSNFGEKKFRSSTSLLECSPQAFSNERNRETLNLNSSNDHENSVDALMNTVLDVQDMSLTECIKLTPPITSVATAEPGTFSNSESKDKKSAGSAICQLMSDREIYVTKRSRGRKPSSEIPLNEDRRSSAFPLLNDSLKRTSNSLVENIENSPPICQEDVARNSSLAITSNQNMPKSPCTVSTIQEDLSQLPSYVVLERLPNNVIVGHCNQDASFKCEYVREIDKKRSSKNKKSTPVQQEHPECNTSPQNLLKSNVDDRMLSRKRSFAASSKSVTVSDEEEDIGSAETRNLPPKQTCKFQPKQSSRSKESRRKNPVKKSTEVVNTRTKSEPISPKANSAPNSATSSPQSSSLKVNKDPHSDLELSESEGHRPRRNAAPTSLKEEKLNKKLRRP